MKSGNIKYHLIYGVMIAFFLFITVFLCVTNNGSSFPKMLNADSVAFSEGWVTAEGEEADLSKLHKIENIPAGVEFSVKNTLPSELDGDSSLFFRSKNIYYSVYVDDELVYSPEIPQSIFYTNSFGTRWSIVELVPEYGGKTVEIRVTKAYDSSRASIDNIRIGNSAGMVLEIISERIVAFITCVLLLFVGLLLVIADVPINMQTRKNHELLYLGFFALSIAMWCFSETNLVQLFDNDSRLMQIVSCYSLMLIPIPTVLYLDAAFVFRYKWLKPVFCTLSAVQVLTCWILHLTGIADVRETLITTHIMLALSAVIFFYIVIKYSVFKGKSQKRNIFRILRGIGLSCISIATVIDLVRFYLNVGTDNAMFVRIGLLIFVVCYGSSSLENTVNAVKLGVKSELISKLAYHDGLTGVGNRTAFEERLVEIDNERPDTNRVGIVMFDVNDLKFINDNMGHQYGDSMITKSAELISAAFSDFNGECYRIGGDEFAVIVSGDDVLGKCEDGLDRFIRSTNRYNETPDKDFRVSIAYGYEIYDKSIHTRTMDIFKRADANMYKTKREMKAVQMRPEEYYKDRIKV